MVQKFRDLKMGIKVFGGFAIVLLLLIMIAVFGYNGLTGVVNRASNKDDVNMLVKLFLKSREHEKNYIMRHDSSYADELKVSIKSLSSKALELKQIFKDQYNKDQMDRVVKASNSYKQKFDSFSDIRKQKELTMSDMRQRAKKVRNDCDVVAHDQMDQLKKMKEKNAVFINTKLKNADDANMLLKLALNAKSKRILLMQGNFELFDEWKGINKKIFHLLLDMKSRFKLQKNIDQSNTIFKHYHEYENEVISFVKQFKIYMKSIEKNGLLSLKAIEDIRKELTQQLQQIFSTVGLENVQQNNKIIQDRLKKADDSNMLIKYVLQAKSLRLLIIKGELDKVKEWREVNQHIFKLTQDLAKRFTSQRNISLTNIILKNYMAYENEMLNFINFYKQSSQKVLAAAITAMKEMEAIREDQKAQLNDSQKRFELSINEKLGIIEDVNLMVKLFIDTRKNEKEVIISGDKKYIDIVNERIQKIMNLSEKVKSVLIIQKNIDQIKAVSSAITSYFESFNQYVELSKKQDNFENEMKNAALNAEKECGDALIDQENKMIYQISKSKSMIFVIVIFSILFGLFISFAITKGVTRPINMSLEISQKLANGDFSNKLNIFQKDEMGDLANSLNKMIENISEMITEISTGIDTISSSSTELSSVSEHMSNNAQKASDLSNSVATAAEQMSSNMSNVAAAVEETSSNVNTVASAAEEMTTTINEIAINTEKAHNISKDALFKTKDASNRVNQLGIAAKEIGTFTETITDISEQTNLLALNATIESARAGEAGKGFAVVANEIKELAKQTSIATDEIRNKIDGIQQSTNVSVEEITSVTAVIDDVNEIVGTIAAAMEQQSVATKDIASNISQASVGTQDVSKNVSQTTTVANEVANKISVVNKAAKDVSNDSNQVKQSALNLNELSEKLNELVRKFKV